MTFCVGPFRYRVIHVRGYIRHNGRNCLGLCDNEKQELLISDRCTVDQQVQTLGHELMEAWIYHHGLPADKEQVCDLMGTAVVAIMRDWMVHMGVRALFA